MRPFTKNIEFLVLACDGIWDCKTSAQIIQHFKSQLPLNGTSLAKIHLTNHRLLDEICPLDFETVED